jgi:hypothetical protein
MVANNLCANQREDKAKPVYPHEVGTARVGR